MNSQTDTKKKSSETPVLEKETENKAESSSALKNIKKRVELLEIAPSGDLDIKFEKITEQITALNSRIDSLKNQMAINFGAFAQMHDAQAELRYFQPLTETLLQTGQQLSDLPLSDNWHKNFEEWQKSFERWVTFPEKYQPKKYGALLEIDTEILKSGNWTEKVNDISPSDDQLAYKKFRILFRNFDDSREAAIANLQYKAWNTFSGQGATQNYIDRFKF